MNATRRLSIAALVVACLHLVFGAIVRISGSGMGCGDHWPKCYGYWFPPFNRPDLIVEVSHRYLASILTITVLSMAFVAFRHRREAGIGGRGGAMRSAFGAVGAVFTAAILGGVTVKMGNAPWATVAHWLVAMTLLAMVATTAIRAGALGGASALVQRGSKRAARSALVAAVLAIFAVALGGLTAKIPGAAVGCTTIPLCGPNPLVERAGVDVQLTHRTLAVLLVLHLIGIVMMLRKRRDEEAPVVIRAANVALAMVLLQLVVASAMILFHLPAVLRSLHEATGVGIWLSCFALAYLARRTSNVDPAPVERGTVSAPVIPPAAPPILSSPSAPALETGQAEGSQAPAFEASPVEVLPEPAAALELVPDEEIAQAPAEPVELIAAEAIAQVPAEPIAAAPDEANAPVPAEAVEVIEAAPEESLPLVAEEPFDEALDEPPVVMEELDWEPRRMRAEEELDEFSIAALEAEVQAMERETQPELVEDAIAHATPVIEAVIAEPVIEAVAAEPIVIAPIVEKVTGDASIVAPPVVAPKLSPLPAPTMAVLVARGADML